MIALIRGAKEVTHNYYIEWINSIKAKKKAKLYIIIHNYLFFIFIKINLI
jgi:hypothetical protein